jgi:hypothetical protein
MSNLFAELDDELNGNVDNQYFQEPREFRLVVEAVFLLVLSFPLFYSRSLIEVLAILNEQVGQMNRRKDLGNDLSAVLKVGPFLYYFIL